MFSLLVLGVVARIRGYRMIWYHIEQDIIFESVELDYAFYALIPMAWDKIELIGTLEGEL